MSAAELFNTQLQVRACEVDVRHEPVPAEQIVSGSPMTGAVELGHWQGLDIGVWEMTPGVMTDVEVDELCIILRGAGTVERVLGTQSVVHDLTAGVVLTLQAGEVTTWRVTETVRKVYLIV